MDMLMSILPVDFFYSSVHLRYSHLVWCLGRTSLPALSGESYGWEWRQSSWFLFSPLWKKSDFPRLASCFKRDFITCPPTQKTISGLPIYCLRQILHKSSCCLP